MCGFNPGRRDSRVDSACVLVEFKNKKMKGRHSRLMIRTSTWAVGPRINYQVCVGCINTCPTL